MVNTFARNQMSFSSHLPSKFVESSPSNPPGTSIGSSRIATKTPLDSRDGLNYRDLHSVGPRVQTYSIYIYSSQLSI